MPRSRHLRIIEEWKQRVLLAAQRELLTPEMTALAVEGYREEYAKAQGERSCMTGRLKSEPAGVSRKMERLLRIVEDGHTDPAVAGPRLNELAAQKRRLAGELALRPEDSSAITVTDGGAGFRELVRKLRQELREGEQGSDEAAELVRGPVNRID